MNHRHLLLAFAAAFGLCVLCAPAAPIVVSISGSGPARDLVGQTIDGSRTIYYNRIGDNSSVGDLTDTSGASTDIAVSWVAGKTGANNTVSAAHPITGAPAAIFTSDAARTFLAIGKPETNFMRWRLDGLEVGSVYDFDIFACREGTGTAASAFTILGKTLLTSSINARGNTDQLLRMNGARPDDFGSLEILLRFGSPSASAFAYFNAFQVTERSLGLVPEPAHILFVIGPLVLAVTRQRRRVDLRAHRTAFRSVLDCGGS